MNQARETITFIVNPKSGLGIFPNIHKRIKSLLKDSKYDIQIHITQYAGHAIELCKELIASKNPPARIVAVGGDGTVNEVVNGIGDSGIPMGIVPIGSGNGLARHLGISLFPTWAIKNIVTGEDIIMDLIKINNEKWAANVAGVGFDALVSWKFKDSKIRGPIIYAKIILEEFLKYKGKKYKIWVDDQEVIELESVMMSVCNSNQFGNNAFIAPKASVCDGLLNLSIIKPFPKALALDLGTKIMTKQIHQSKYFKSLVGKKFKIQLPKAMFQIDGDSAYEVDELNLEVVPQVLKIIIPKKHINKI